MGLSLCSHTICCKNYLCSLIAPLFLCTRSFDCIYVAQCLRSLLCSNDHLSVLQPMPHCLITGASWEVFMSVLQLVFLQYSYPLKSICLALAGVAQWIECWPVRFPVRAHAWVARQVPSGRHARGNHTLMFLSLSLPPFPSL